MLKTTSFERFVWVVVKRNNRMTNRRMMNIQTRQANGDFLVCLFFVRYSIVAVTKSQFRDRFNNNLERNFPNLELGIQN